MADRRLIDLPAFERAAHASPLCFPASLRARRHPGGRFPMPVPMSHHPAPMMRIEAEWHRRQSP